MRRIQELILLYLIFFIFFILGPSMRIIFFGVFFFSLIFLGSFVWNQESTKERKCRGKSGRKKMGGK